MPEYTLIFSAFLLIAAVAVFLTVRHLFVGSSPRALQKKRLEILETCPLDKERTLTLIRWDGEEHLLLVGGSSDLCIEKQAGPAVLKHKAPPLASDLETRPSSGARSLFEPHALHHGTEPSLSFPPLRSPPQDQKPVIFSENLSSLSFAAKEPSLTAVSDPSSFQEKN